MATSMTKLTLNADRTLIRQAKSIAAKRHTSVSAMFASLLRAMTQDGDARPATLPPLTRQASGLVKMPSNKSDRELLEEALVAKYR
jgi:hypothetical protein